MCSSSKTVKKINCFRSIIQHSCVVLIGNRIISSNVLPSDLTVVIVCRQLKRFLSSTSKSTYVFGRIRINDVIECARVLCVVIQCVQCNDRVTSAKILIERRRSNLRVLFKQTKRSKLNSEGSMGYNTVVDNISHLDGAAMHPVLQSEVKCYLKSWHPCRVAKIWFNVKRTYYWHLTCLIFYLQ